MIVMADCYKDTKLIYIKAFGKKGMYVCVFTETYCPVSCELHLSQTFHLFFLSLFLFPLKNAKIKIVKACISFTPKKKIEINLERLRLLLKLLFAFLTNKQK